MLIGLVGRFLMFGKVLFSGVYWVNSLCKGVVFMGLMIKWWFFCWMVIFEIGNLNLCGICMVWFCLLWNRCVWWVLWVGMGIFNLNRMVYVIVYISWCEFVMYLCWCWCIDWLVCLFGVNYLLLWVCFSLSGFLWVMVCVGLLLCSLWNDGWCNCLVGVYLRNVILVMSFGFS